MKGWVFACRGACFGGERGGWFMFRQEGVEGAPSTHTHTGPTAPHPAIRHPQNHKATLGHRRRRHPPAGASWPACCPAGSTARTTPSRRCACTPRPRAPAARRSSRRRCRRRSGRQTGRGRACRSARSGGSPVFVGGVGLEGWWVGCAVGWVCGGVGGACEPGAGTCSQTRRQRPPTCCTTDPPLGPLSTPPSPVPTRAAP